MLIAKSCESTTESQKEEQKDLGMTLFLVGPTIWILTEQSQL